jgi:hypothetical protein
LNSSKNTENARCSKKWRSSNKSVRKKNWKSSKLSRRSRNIISTLKSNVENSKSTVNYKFYPKPRIMIRKGRRRGRSVSAWRKNNATKKRKRKWFKTISRRS